MRAREECQWCAHLMGAATPALAMLENSLTSDNTADDNGS